MIPARPPLRRPDPTTEIPEWDCPVAGCGHRVTWTPNLHSWVCDSDDSGNPGHGPFDDAEVLCRYPIRDLRLVGQR